jgi:Galactose oxidase, central domain/Kelch motif
MLSKKMSILLIAIAGCAMAACSGLKATSTGGTGGTGGGNVTATIGGQITGLLQGASVILQNNGGDALTVTANGTFTFKTPVTGPTDAYAVTVNAQPTNPNELCTVTGGSGTASANVDTVLVNCVASFTVGGTVTGLVGTGFALQNSDGTILETLPISAATGNAAFTFKQLVPTGSTYTVAIATQPGNPAQTCTITPGTGSGMATANVSSVAVTCAAVTYSVGGTVVGVAGVAPGNGEIADNSFVLQNVLGNTLIIPRNGPFTFATPEALNDQFEISVFHGPSTQNQGCTLWDYKGVVTTNITSIIVDCGHNDWTWIDGTNTAGTVIPVTPQYGQFPSTAPTTIPNPFTNTPGARYGAAGWTDQFGSLYLFGGDGWELTGKSPPDSLNGAMNDLWVCDMSWGYFCQWQLVGGYDPTAITFNGKATTVGAVIVGGAQQVNGYPYSVPAGRLGAATWKDTAGNFWMFGGSDGNNFMNDLWEYNPSALNPSTYTTKEGAWGFVSGSFAVDQPGIYPPSVNAAPGARTNAVTWTDASGNFWLFGGYGYDGQAVSVLGFLNDLWEYTGGKWVFVGGSSVANQIGVYGNQGTADPGNIPGGRQEAVGWADASGNLWLFGGEGMDDVGTPNGILNDLWVYNISSNEWTWVMGAEPVTNSTRANHNGVYPSQPVIGPVNTTGAASTCGLPSGLTVNSQVLCSAVDTTGALPGSRWGAAGWIDAAGNLWLFGGWGLDSKATNGNGALDDLWVYTPNSTVGQPGTWAWVKGSNTGSQNGIYGDKLIPYKTFEQWTPGGRSNATHWIDTRGQLWMFGGEGYDSTSTTGNGYLNDLWRYLPYKDN